MASQAGRVRSSSLRSSGNVIRCTGFPMAATIAAPISYLYPKLMRASLSWCLVAVGWCAGPQVELCHKMRSGHRCTTRVLAASCSTSSRPEPSRCGRRPWPRCSEQPHGGRDIPIHGLLPTRDQVQRIRHRSGATGPVRRSRVLRRVRARRSSSDSRPQTPVS